MEVLVIGGGFVGTVSAVVFAEADHHVQLVENDPDRRAALQDGRPGFEEPGLGSALRQQLRRGHLEVPESMDAARPPQVAVVCVGTPAAPDGSADLSQVVAACREAAGRMDGGVIAVKSTVPPGTLRTLVAPAVEAVDPSVRVASLPEFLAEGNALEGARRPERVVIGSDHKPTTGTLTDLHAGLSAKVVATDPTTAESIKYASNAMLAARIGVVNELANVCEAVGVSVDEVMGAVGLDPRIGPLFLQAGLGFGGSCFPKDVSALCCLARERGVPMRILETVLQSNDAQPLRAVRLLEEELGNLRGKQIALLGLSFKPGTSDLRESRAVAIHKALRARGANVVAHDPAASDHFRRQVPEAVLVADPTDAVAGADACIVATAWPQYRALPWTKLAATMARPLIIDGWRTLDPATLGTEVRYRAIGRGTVTA